MLPQPIYTPANCTSAYQLRWSLALFPDRPLPPKTGWIERFNQAASVDSVRILEHTRRENSTELLLVSTQPCVAPASIVRSVKGRLSNLLQSEHPVRWQRNFRLTSVGGASAADVQNYVANQLAHHPLADPRTTAAMQEFQLQFDVDVSEVINSAHGQYAVALHLVLVHAERWRTAEQEFMRKTRNAILDVANKKQHRISRFALLPDHVHLTMAIDYERSPESVALSYMNNIAFRHGMVRMWMDSFYVGTIGKFDMDAIRRRV